MNNKPYRYKVLDVAEYGSMEVTIVDTENGETIKKTKNGARLFAIKHPVEGIVLDGRKFVSAAPVDFRSCLIGTPETDYDVIRFFNHLCLEIDDIPKEVEAMALAVRNGAEYIPSASFSHYDDAMSLYKDYHAIKDILPPEEFYRVIFGKEREGNAFCKTFDTYSRYVR